jgi:hypothetical protein
MLDFCRSVGDTATPNLGKVSVYYDSVHYLDSFTAGITSALISKQLHSENSQLFHKTILMFLLL